MKICKSGYGADIAINFILTGPEFVGVRKTNLRGAPDVVRLIVTDARKLPVKCPGCGTMFLEEGAVASLTHAQFSQLCELVPAHFTGSIRNMIMGARATQRRSLERANPERN